MELTIGVMITITMIIIFYFAYNFSNGLIDDLEYIDKCINSKNKKIRKRANKILKKNCRLFI